MTTSASTVQEIEVRVAGGNVRVRHDGSGDPLLVLHHDIGNHAWMPFHEQLAKSFHTYVPDLPGYGGSDRPEWARHVRDYAAMMNLLLDNMEIDTVTLVGLGYGGWIAAEMATFNQRRLNKLVLVGAMGIQPQEGEIMDQYMVSFADYVRAGFRDLAAFEKHFGEEPAPEIDSFWDFSREMTARITWKPYMFNQQLPHLLQDVRVPTLIVWGRQDQIVPVNCAELYAQALPVSQLEVLEEAGHWIDMEEPELLSQLVSRHVSGR